MNSRGIAHPVILALLVITVAIVSYVYLRSSQAPIVDTVNNVVPPVEPKEDATVEEEPEEEDVSRYKVTDEELRNQLISLTLDKKDYILANSGTVAVDIDIGAVNRFLLDEDVYSVSFGWIDKDGNNIPAGPGYVLIGDVYGELTVAEYFDDNYCKWTSSPEIDETSQVFMGIEYCDSAP